MITTVPSFQLSHRHEPGECVAAFAAWRGFDSPLRGRATVSSCLAGGHRLWWQVEATSPEEALGQLPPFVAERCEVAEVREVAIP
jgi:hypothetical protein